jgi:hypothetical protein
MQQVEFVLSAYTYRMLILDDRQVAVPCCRVYSLSARARYSTGGLNNIYELVQPHIVFNRIFPIITGIIYFSGL